MKTALISVSDKTNLKPLLIKLLFSNYQIISTGGTYKFIIENSPEEYKKYIYKVEDFTKFPEILEGRVKTLHPKIYGGILYDPNLESHEKDFNNPYNELTKIDMVVVNLYPFREVITKINFREEEAIENIDIGGVSLLRAAAKNYKNVIVLSDIEDYKSYIRDRENIERCFNERKKFAIKAFEHVTNYDQEITNYFDPKIKYRKYKIVQNLKYGCNPHQENSQILKIENKPIDILYGSPGYINYLDAIHGWCLVVEAEKSLNYTVSASYKHTSPAGVGTSKYQISEKESEVYDLQKYDLKNSPTARAFIRARNSDPLSSFGDFISVSGIIDETCAQLIKREVSDGIIAEGYTDEALEILKKKKNGNYIILKGDKNIKLGVKEYREIFGMVLTQESNKEIINERYLKNIVTENNIMPPKKREDLILATITLKYTPSNSIVIADKCQVIGVGAGQQNRVDCIKLAGKKALIYKLRFHEKVLNLTKKFKTGVTRQEKINCIIKYINNDFTVSELERWLQNFERNDIIEMLTEKQQFKKNLKGLSMSSDAFFPFRDNIDYAFRFGVDYILNPGGSICDKEIIEACNEYKICMAISGKRLFLH